ncbi:MAG TPA: flavin reductase family protein [Mycobacterium sp.]|nr:flavin reductase family protein [Mycobacterium sp.]
MQTIDTLLRGSEISTDDFRLAMRRLAGGVSIISGAGPDDPLGVTATAVTSLTLRTHPACCAA